ncbi:MAG: reverse transcriptase domain-containing protein [Nanoarchaeota archaeon]
MPCTTFGAEGFRIYLDNSTDYSRPDGSVLLAEKAPGVPVAYFGGPMLPQFYTNELLNYFNRLGYSPIGALLDKDVRRRIVSGIVGLLGDKQGNLFSSVEDDLNATFDGLVALSERDRPLYRQWTQDTGKKNRTLSTPQEPLEHLLREYVSPIVMQAPLHPCAHGGEVGWSAARSLACHLPLGSVLSFDLTNAFQNTGIQYVFDFYYGFLHERLGDEELARDLSGFLATASTVRYRDNGTTPGLPQGSPLSMALFNRLFYPVDCLIAEKCSKRNLRYTRWVDDLTISARERDRRFDKVAGVMAFVREDFPIATHKIFWQQDKPEYYLLGHKILGNLIVKVSDEESRNRGEPVHEDAFRNRWELEHSWMHDGADDFSDEFSDFVDENGEKIVF